MRCTSASISALARFCSLLAFVRSFVPYERHHADPQQPRLGAQPQHLDKESRQRLLVQLAKAADGGVVGHLVRGEHAEGDVLPEVVLGKPVPEARGHQVLLVTVARQEALGHGRHLGTTPSPPPCASYTERPIPRFCDSLSRVLKKRRSGGN
jgi:hypothetical protein